MAIKVTAFLITLLINVITGVVIFLFMLFAMNGYSEADAQYGLGAYILLALIVSLMMSIFATVLVHILMKRKFRGWTAMLITVPIFSVLGAGLKLASSVAGVAVAEFVRLKY
jgi:hypothetical protein